MESLRDDVIKQMQSLLREVGSDGGKIGPSIYDTAYLAGGAGPSMKVCVVEDDASMRRALRRLLKAASRALILNIVR